MSKKIKMQHRNFRIGERAFNCDYDKRDNFGFGVISKINGKPENAKINSDDIVQIVIGDRVVETKGCNVYKIAPRISKKVGETICYEHNILSVNYPFYVPNADENYFRFELGV